MRSPTGPLVSIIVPSHVTTAHQAALLVETLDTVTRQTTTDYELIVVDDGSSVDLAPIVGERSRTTLLRQENRGPAVARNRGIAESRGPFLVFLDADDHLLPAALETGLSMFDAHPGAGFVVGPHEEMTFEGEPVPWSVAPPPAGVSRIYRALLGFDWYIIPPSSCMFRRTVVETIGGFQDPWGADDLDFYLRAAHSFDAWCYQAPPVTRYRRYSASSSRDGARMLHSVRIVYERQRALIHGDAAAEAAFDRGLRQLTSIFLDGLVENISDRLRGGEHDRALSSARLLVRESPDRWRALVAREPSLVEDLARELSVS